MKKFNPVRFVLSVACATGANFLQTVALMLSADNQIPESMEKAFKGPTDEPITKEQKEALAKKKPIGFRPNSLTA